jgi:hypothetical protein
MAKGQKRSGREPKKKPKDHTTKVAPGGTHSTTAQDLIKQPTQKADTK